MSVLEVCQRVSSVIGIERPSAVFGATDRELIELGDACNDVVEMLVDWTDWPELLVRQTETGDGSTEAFALPTDFKRLPTPGRIWTSRLQYSYDRVDSIDQWNEILVRDYDYVSGVWITFGGNINIKPAPTATETISYFYVSKNIVQNSGGTPKALITADDDQLRIPERLLRLGVIWKWFENKKLPYEEHMNDFMEAVEAEAHAQRMPEIITVGRMRIERGTKTAYPTVLT